DSPDKVLRDVQNKRARGDKSEAARMLAEARKLFEQGNLEGAKVLATKAEQMNGPGGYWDVGDQPANLLTEIYAAQTKKQMAGTKSQGPAKTVATADGFKKPDVPPGFINPDAIQAPPLKNVKPELPAVPGSNVATVAVNAGTPVLPPPAPL